MARLTRQDEQLVRAARQFLAQRYAKGKHHVACALQCGGKTYLALHLDSQGFDICAEPIAISNALLDKQKDFNTIVAVAMDDSRKTQVVPPCGNCRQILSEYSPGVSIVIPSHDKLEKVKTSQLLPFPYRRVPDA